MSSQFTIKNSSPIFALIDCNSFFCSCERVFRPNTLNQPIIVLSNNDGCVISRSDEAKALGIKMCEPFFKIKELCQRKNVHVFSSNHALYGDMSRRVMKCISEAVPEMEIYSVDEAFVYLNGLSQDSALQQAHNIKESIFQNTGIPVSIGIGPTRVLAKMANQIAKNNKSKTHCVFSLLDSSSRDHHLKQFPIGEIWGIGRKSAQKLLLHEIKTALDLKNTDKKWASRLLNVNGTKIISELNGESCIDLNNASDERKQILSSRSFESTIRDPALLQNSIALHISTACEKLRKQNSLAQTLTVFIQTSPHKQTPQYYNSASLQIHSGTASTNTLIKHAFALFNKIYKRGYEYKKTGIFLGQLISQNKSQYDLFNDHDSQKNEKLMSIMDRINKHSGKDTIKFGACGIDAFSKYACKMKSPYYTTRWNDLISAN